MEPSPEMSGVDTRNLSRDSLFMMAELRLDGQETGQRVKVRNLSPGGMMAEGGPSVTTGARLSVELRNIGWVDGNVAWVQDNRFGIAFAREIDPKLARSNVAANTGESNTPRFIRTVGSMSGEDPSKRKLRNI